jgi:hypothetical protein
MRCVRTPRGSGLAPSPEKPLDRGRDHQLATITATGSTTSSGRMEISSASGPRAATSRRHGHCCLGNWSLGRTRLPQRAAPGRCPLEGNCGHWWIFERDGSVANDPSRKCRVHRSSRDNGELDQQLAEARAQTKRLEVEGQARRVKRRYFLRRTLFFGAPIK